MSIDEFIDKMIIFTIYLVLIWIFFNFILIIYYLGHIIGIYSIDNPTNKLKIIEEDIEKIKNEAVLNDKKITIKNIKTVLIILIRICINIIKYIMPFLTFLVWLIFYILIYIFVAWISIILFVPYIILVQIPFIPFIIPVPLKYLMLEYIPPFKKLTDKGILPLLRRIIYRLFEYFPQGKFKEWINYTKDDVYSFFYEEFKKIFTYLFKNSGYNLELSKPEKINLSKDIEDNEFPINNKEIDEGKEETEKLKKEEENNDENKKIKELIAEELEICLKSKQSLITSDMSTLETSFTGVKDMNNYAECYSKTVKSYFDNLL